MPKTPGVGERVRERLKALGYWKNGRPDVGRFCEEKGYIPSYVYRWIAGETPRGWRLLKLATDLEVAPEWLVPQPSRPRSPVRRALACLVAAATIAMVPYASEAANDPTPSVASVDLAYYVARLFRRLRSIFATAQDMGRGFPGLTACAR